MKTNKVVNLCMMVAAVTIVLVVYPTSGYGQECGSGNDTNCNVTTGYQIMGTTVLAEPGNTLAVGYSAMPGNTSLFSTAVGNFALVSNTIGESNTATGTGALASNTIGNFNTAIGDSALLLNTTGEFNTATGASALYFNTTGPHNTADGTDALALNNTGGDNTASGYNALGSNTTGSGNTASGYHALYASTGNGNTALGYEACINVTNASKVICIGGSVRGTNTSNTTYIGGIFGKAVSGPPAPGVCINSEGQLGTANCDPPAQQEVVNRQQQQIQAQGQQIADLQQRLSRLESLIAKK